LVSAVRAGDDHAFEQLYHRYQRRIGAHVYGMVRDHGRAEDITQDVFVSALRRMRENETPIAFKPWLYEIAKNACIDAFRRSSRAEEISYDADGGDRLRLVSTGPSPEAAVDTRMSLDDLRGAFAGLSAAHHQILVMREFEGLSYRQIGERLGMSRPSVESTLFRARRRLSEEYEELVSGERCRRIRSIIAVGRAGARDERRLARHVSCCRPCRRAALAAGFDPATLTPKRSARDRIAALLPLPAFLRRRWAGDGGAPASSAAHGATLAQLSGAAATCAEPVAQGWAKAAAVAATVALAAVGAGVGGHQAGLLGGTRDEHAAPLMRRAAPGTHDALTTRPAANTPSAGRAATPSGSGNRSGSSGGAGSGAGTAAPSSSAPAGAGPVSSETATRLTAAATGDPVSKTVRRLTEPGPGGVAGRTPAAPKFEAPRLPDSPASVPDPAGVVGGATGAVNDATGAVTGAVNDATGAVTGTVDGAAGAATGTVDGAAGTAAGAVGGTVGGVTGGGGIIPGG
jgi:RNA polymerase sigma factor (sigma-70 family)